MNLPPAKKPKQLYRVAVSPSFFTFTNDSQVIARQYLYPKLSTYSMNVATLRQWVCSQSTFCFLLNYCFQQLLNTRLNNFPAEVYALIETEFAFCLYFSTYKQESLFFSLTELDPINKEFTAKICWKLISVV